MKKNSKFLALKFDLKKKILQTNFYSIILMLRPPSRLKLLLVLGLIGNAYILAVPIKITYTKTIIY